MIYTVSLKNYLKGSAPIILIDALLSKKKPLIDKSTGAILDINTHVFEKPGPENHKSLRWISAGYPPDLDAHWPQTGGYPADIHRRDL